MFPFTIPRQKSTTSEGKVASRTPASGERVRSFLILRIPHVGKARVAVLRKSTGNFLPLKTPTDTKQSLVAMGLRG